MCDIAHSFYSTLYTPEETSVEAQEELLAHVTDKFSVTAADSLNAELSIDEIKEALSLMNSNKAPGPDGLSPALYKALADTLLPLMLSAFKAALSMESFPEELSLGQIILLYKSGDPTLMKNYRPITLLNSDYKIITKALSRRFSKVLHEVAGPYQHAFIPGRRAADCTITLNLVFESLRAQNQPGTILSLDMEKAYDRVHHEWMFKTLERLGVGNNILQWIKSLYSNAKSSCRVNGFHSQLIDLKRGVRQGDALSCALYIITLIPFILSIAKSEKIKGIKCKGGICVSVLAYADDTTVLLDPDADVTELLRIFSVFSRASNAKINMQKTFSIAVNNAAPLEGGFQNLEEGESTVILGYPYSTQGLLESQNY